MFEAATAIYRVTRTPRVHAGGRKKSQRAIQSRRSLRRRPGRPWRTVEPIAPGPRDGYDSCNRGLDKDPSSADDLPAFFSTTTSMLIQKV